MKIRKKITLVYAILVGLIVFSLSLYIFFLAKEYSLASFYTKLKERAIVAATVYFEKDELSEKLYSQNLEDFPHSLNEEVIRIYDRNDNSLFNDEKSTLTFSNKIIDRIRKDKYKEFSDGERQDVGMLYADNEGNFVIIISAIDDVGNNKIQYLKRVLVVGFFIAVLFVLLTGRVITNPILNPINEILRKVNNITATNLHLRLTEVKGKDELAELAATFNKMLIRLEDAFESQKNFIRHASHEIRSPLTSIIGKIDVTLSKDRDTEEYKKILQVILVEAERLNKLTTGLLSIAHLNSNQDKIEMENVRIDELLMDIKHDLQIQIPDSNIRINFHDLPDNPAEFEIAGNRNLLYSAIYNIAENAIKFSNKQPVEFEIAIMANEIMIKIKDKGIGIAQEDFGNIFQPFYRTKNALTFSGSGIGLSLAEKLVQLHNGKIILHSEIGKGSVFEIILAK